MMLQADCRIVLFLLRYPEKCIFFNVLFMFIQMTSFLGQFADSSVVHIFLLSRHVAKAYQVALFHSQSFKYGGVQFPHNEKKCSFIW